MQTVHPPLTPSSRVPQADWQNEVRERLSSEHPAYNSLSADEQFSLFLEYVLHTDMRHYWIVPGHAAGGCPVRPWFVQVEHVEDVSQPAKRRYVANSTSGSGGGTSQGRLLKMMVFDGQQHHAAIEHVQIPFGTAWPRLGSKMVIDEGAVLRDGIFLLTPGTCGVLGGAVEEFELRQRVVDEVLQEPVYGRRGPPLQLEAYMEGVDERVRERVGNEDGRVGRHPGQHGAHGATEGRVLTGGVMANTAAPIDVNRNKRYVIEEDSSDDDFGDVSKRQKDDVPTGVPAQVVRNVDDDVINLLSSDDE